MILREISLSSNGIGVNAIADKLNLPKSTTSRILSTLEDWNVVERMADKRFEIGPGLIRLVEKRPFAATLQALARPVLEKIAAQTEEAVLLVILDGLSAYYLDHVPSTQAVQVRDWSGQHVPLNLTSGGKLLLAYADSKLVERFFTRPLTGHTKNSIVDPTALRTALASIRQQGYAMTSGEYDDEVAGISVPIGDQSGGVVAAVTVYGPVFRLVQGERQAEILHIMRQATTELML